MRRERRKVEQDNSMKNILYLLGTILGISIIAFIITFVTYDSNSEEVKPERIAQIISNTTQNEFLEQASTQISKTVEEVKEEALEAEQQINRVGVFDGTEEEKNEENTVTQNQVQVTNAKPVQPTEPVQQKKLEFIMPVSGETSKEFAKDNLVYSNTLKEWITHYGIDIQAEKTTVVKAAEDGEVISIKTDPRYGITVIIKHNEGFETRYANLLTAEFVKVGEKVTKGQTIGTVGNTGAFEIADNPHLHFEMLKDNEYVNPTIYIK